MGRSLGESIPKDEENGEYNDYRQESASEKYFEINCTSSCSFWGFVKEVTLGMERCRALATGGTGL